MRVRVSDVDKKRGDAQNILTLEVILLEIFKLLY